MTNENNNTAWVKLYHPRGPLVTLPIPADPKEAFSHIWTCLDVGWLTIAPGLDEGEQKEEVGFIVRGECDGNGETTPFLLLYPANETHSFSFLKVYLNTSSDIAAFEFASKMMLADLPEYAGNDKPERGKSAKMDAFIVRMKKPFGVVMKDNPKYNETDRAAHVQRGQIYKVPRRLFVRWVDQAPVNATSEAAPAPKPVPVPSTNRVTNPPVPKAAAPLSADDKHKIVIDGYAKAKNEAKVMEFAAWADKQDFATHHHEEQDDAYNAALERLRVGVMVGVAEDIPY